jgi:hypothetical protein
MCNSFIDLRTERQERGKRGRQEAQERGKREARERRERGEREARERRERGKREARERQAGQWWYQISKGSVLDRHSNGDTINLALCCIAISKRVGVAITYCSCYKHITKMSQGCYDNARRVLRGYYEGVTRVIRMLQKLQ